MWAAYPEQSKDRIHCASHRNQSEPPHVFHHPERSEVEGLLFIRISTMGAPS
jgi:hypothetical protein